MRASACVGLLLTLSMMACQRGGAASPPEAGRARRPAWVLVIHGGAGSARPESTSPERVTAFTEGLKAALTRGKEILERGGSSVDAVEAVIATLEDDPAFNAGKGAVFTHEGRNELDASIMDGATMRCGAVTGVTRVKNPIKLARAVMERSRHVFFAGEGAERFAERVGLELVDPSYFFTQRRWDALQRALEKERSAPAGHGTVGAVALDREGRLAAGTSTGGLTNKATGRIGDSPVIGAGTYADGTAAISCTGQGEQFIRYTVARTVAALVEYKGLTLEQAAHHVIDDVLRPGDGGLIAVGADGSVAMVYSTPSMLRGVADADGRFEVAIW
ncbi:MAG: isoaspartyl peptidase/L-asparaginase [Acidobacteria bacterium]|nr:MAG: isoaspartyl peptidase/L-asparaginase [Acidobacteriota bacterium]